MDSIHFFSLQEQDEIVALIQDVELKSSCEIRVHIDDELKGEASKRAQSVFKNLKMHKTAERNGVLLYVSLQPKSFYILGDKGIHQMVDESFWENITQEVIEKFKEKQFAEGVKNAIERCGEQLKHFFPYQEDDVNELSDEVSFNEE